MLWTIIVHHKADMHASFQLKIGGVPVPSIAAQSALHEWAGRALTARGLKLAGLIPATALESARLPGEPPRGSGRSHRHRDRARSRGYARHM
jgi:hypothetical protein